MGTFSRRSQEVGAQPEDPTVRLARDEVPQEI